jgi:type I restriction-modification system DNA methylase subunit
MEQVIKNIRDTLREEGITGMDSVNHCLCFLVCRFLNKDICVKLNIPLEFTYENILLDNNGKELGEQEFFNKFYQKQAAKDSFYKFLKLNIGYENFLFKLKGTYNLITIVRSLKNIDINNLTNVYDLVGFIYEIHLKSGTSNAMRDLGQYFTHRLVIKYMIQLCDPKLIDGKIETIVDPTMGTGGFLTMAVKYLNNKYQNIDWSKNKENIYGFDIDENVKNMAILNLLLETHELCNVNLIKNDTLKYDMRLKNNTILEKADIILANEPMGLKGIKYEECSDRIKSLGFKGTKAEPLFLQLFMQSLNKNGRCAVVVPDGVLFNNNILYINTRKYLVNNLNLKKVISLNDKNFFLNTGVSTSILYFENIGETEKVEFLELNLAKNQQGIEEIIEKLTAEVSCQQIKDNGYTLFVNKYIVKEETKIKGIEYKKLGDVCDFLPKSKRSASFGKDEGKYPFYTSSMKSKFCDEIDYIDECIIIGTGGNANIKFDKNFSCSSDNFILKSKNENIDIKYLYYYFMINIKNLEDGFSGSTIKHISKNYINDLDIPIQSIEIQKKIVEQLDVLSENNKTCQKLIDEFKNVMKIYVETNTRNGEKKKLGDVCEYIKTGKNKPIDNKQGKLYPYYGTSGITGYTDEYLFDGSHILTPRNGTIGNIFFISDKFFASDHMFVIKNKKIYNIKYIEYYLKFCVDLNQYKHGSTIPNIKLSDLNDLMITINNVDKIVKYCSDLDNQITKLEEQINDNNLLMKQILDSYLSVNNESNDKEESESKIKKIKINKKIVKTL